MKGIELSRAYFEEYGKPMLKEAFSEFSDRIAVGLVGHGSECFGFDDDISPDHDFEPGFCIWLTDRDEQTFGFRLFRAYSKLPKEFMGVKCLNKSAMGSKKKGVIRIFKKQGITEATCGSLESHAYSINDQISSSEIRNLHVFYNEQ